MKKNKVDKIPRKGILVTGELVAITDPAELAEIDRRCREAEKVLAAREALKKTKPRKRK